MKISNRALFLMSALSGLIVGLPAWAIAKGQWCNDVFVRHKVSLTVQAVTVAGFARTPPADGVYELTSKAFDPAGASGPLHCPVCPGEVRSVELVWQP